MKKPLVILGVAAALVVALYWWNQAQGPVEPPETRPDAGIGEGMAVVLGGGLDIPWGIAFLPDGDMLITERPGRIRLYDAETGLLDGPLLVIGDVVHRGEGGLLGIAVHPQFPEQPYVYVYYTYQEAQALANCVVRYTLVGGSLGNRQVLLAGIPGANIHNGGRLKFGPDGCLYVTTGDAAVPERAQDVGSLAGKILRLADDGSIPTDNPSPDSPVYSLGHRNPQGLAWDDEGWLWSTEHGQNATDEVNRIRPGANYGWPVIRGDETAAGLESPVLHSGRDTWAPSGLAYLDGSLFFAGLRGGSLFEVQLPSTVLVRHLYGEFGRVREVVVGPDGSLYLLTSNRDGRGTPAADDDRLIRVDLEKL